MPDILEKYHVGDKWRGLSFSLGRQGDPAIIKEDAGLIYDALYQIFQTNRGERCLAGETLIPLFSGEILPLKSLVGKSNFYIYSYDHETESIRPGLVTAVMQTQTAAEVMKVTLDTGDEIVTTPDHMYMRRNSQYVFAHDLKKNNVLMPLSRKFKRKMANQYRKLNKKYKENYSFLDDPTAVNLSWVPTFEKNGKDFFYRKRKLACDPELLDERIDVYCMKVDTYQNFALEAGIFVHNCGFPEFGSDLPALLFEPNDAFLYQQIASEIQRSIALWEPRVQVQDVQFEATSDDLNNGRLYLLLSFSVINNPRVTTIRVPLSSTGRLFG